MPEQGRQIVPNDGREETASAPNLGEDGDVVGGSSGKIMGHSFAGCGVKTRADARGSGSGGAGVRL